MLKVEYKSKIPSILSYPVGAELVSSHLEGVPQELTIIFHERPFISASEFQQVLRQKEPYAILRGCYTKIERGISSSNDDFFRRYHDGFWQIQIFPVIRQQKSIARAALLDSGLTGVKQWLLRPRTDIWLRGRRKIDVLFSEVEGSVELKEYDAA